jgi:ankyrin repeat protein
MHERRLSLTTFVLAIVAIGPGCAPRITPTDAARMNTFTLQAAAAQASSLEDSAFFFLAAQMRYKIDRQVYPSAQTGADDPAVLKSAMNAVIGQAIMSKVAADPTARGKALARLAGWFPEFPAGYAPGWKFTKQLDAAATAKVIESVRADVLKALKAQNTLADNDEHGRLSKELAAAAGEVNRLESLAAKSRPLPDQLRDQIISAHRRATDIAERMKDIEFHLLPDSRWHARIGWKAEEFFANEQVIALCKAIEADELATMRELIAAGVDVNAVGKNGMTPLLWAFPDRKLERFRLLLQHGANPNVPLTGDVGLKDKAFHPYVKGGASFLDRGCHEGHTVMLLACRSPVGEYFQAVMEHGGDATLADTKTGEVPLDIVLDRYIPDSRQRVEVLLRHDVALDRHSPWRSASPLVAAFDNGHYDVAVLLLESGADPTLVHPNFGRRLIHEIARSLQPDAAGRVRAIDETLQSLIDKLAARGETLAQAEMDVKERKAKRPPVRGRE